MKIAWSLIVDRESLWVRIIRNKYSCGDAIIPIVQKKQSSSNLWQGICDVWEDVRDSTIWRIGNGLSIRFWSDRWVPGHDQLSLHACISLSNVECERKLIDFITPSGDWNYELFVNFLPPLTVDVIRGLIPPCHSSIDDYPAWKHTYNGSFSVRSAYHSLIHVEPPLQQINWKILWKWPGPPKIRNFLWLTAHERIQVRLFLFNKNIASSPSCPFSCGQDESVVHCLRDCAHAAKLWKSLVAPNKAQVFFNSSLPEWIGLNMSSRMGNFSSSGLDWFGLGNCFWLHLLEYLAQ